MDLVVLALRLALATVFAVAAFGKARDLAGSRKALTDFGVPERLAALGGPALLILEVAIAAALIVTPTAQAGAIAALVLLLAFVAGIARLLHAGQAPDCHCFGSIHSEPVGPATLARNGILAAAAVVVAIGAPGRHWSSFDSTSLVLVLVAWGATALAVATVLLARENAELRKRPARRRRPSGLPKGSLAPHFTLPDVGGGEVSLDDHLEAGRPAVVAFVSPSCEPCQGLLPELARWQRTVADDIAVLVLSTGDEQANRELADEHGVESLLTAPPHLLNTYRVGGTPGAVLVATDGTIDTAPATGAPTIEALVRIALRRAGAAPPPPAPVTLQVSRG